MAPTTAPLAILLRVDQFDLALQQQVEHDLTFTIGYVGNIGERVYDHYRMSTLHEAVEAIWANSGSHPFHTHRLQLIPAVPLSH